MADLGLVGHVAAATPDIAAPAEGTSTMTSDTAVTRARRRQRGTDRDATPQPAQHARPSTARIARSRIALISCVVLWMLYLATVIGLFGHSVGVMG